MEAPHKVSQESLRLQVEILKPKSPFNDRLSNLIPIHWVEAQTFIIPGPEEEIVHSIDLDGDFTGNDMVAQPVD